MSLLTLLETIGALVAVGSLVYTARAVGVSRKTARAQFWLELRDRFATHNSVHRHLRPGGAWADARTGPSTADDWRDVESYLGLFEHCEIMLQEGLIDTKTLRAIYQYRVGNVLANPIIVEGKLVRHAREWRYFLALVRRLGFTIPDAGQQPPTP